MVNAKLSTVKKRCITMEENASITGNACPEFVMMKLVSAKEGKWENLVLIISSVIKL